MPSGQYVGYYINRSRNNALVALNMAIVFRQNSVSGGGQDDKGKFEIINGSITYRGKGHMTGCWMCGMLYLGCGLPGMLGS
jgi:hypothetical protein